MNTKPKYRIRLDENGFYGSLIWQSSPLDKARIYDTMKQARRTLNRLRDRFHYNKAEIEIHKP